METPQSEPPSVAKPKLIAHTRFLAVEGIDEVRFFRKLLQHIGVSGCQVEDVGGKGSFNKELPALKLRTGYDLVEILAVIRDADEQGIEQSFESLRGTLTRNGLEAPPAPGTYSAGRPRVGVFIIDDGSGRGMLEDLCLKTVKDHPALRCVEEFSLCVGKLPNPPKNPTKSRAQAFLGAMPEIVSSVGLGAEKDYWNFESPELGPLISFLRNLG